MLMCLSRNKSESYKYVNKIEDLDHQALEYIDINNIINKNINID